MAAPLHGDPTKVTGRRILAYLVDSILGLALMALLLYPSVSDKIDSQRLGSDTVASQTCRSINRELRDEFDPDRNGGSTNTTFELDDIDGVCLNVGDTAYTATGKDLQSLQTSASLLGLAITVGNLVVLQGLVGASIGKFLVGLRVVREDGRPAGIGWSILRWILLFVDSFCCALVGLIAMFTSKGHRRVGDMAAGTFVVGKQHAGRPLSVPGVTTSTPGGGWPPAGSAPPWTPPGTGAPSSPYGAPGPAGPGGPDATQVNPATPGAEGPTWDAQRGAYIQYDRDRSAWVQWDDAASTWGPISQ